jgi:pimeloyl-ACP methyl ester carboxylesterase
VLWGVLGILAGVIVLDVLIRIVAVVSILPILERSPPFAVEPTSPAPAAERVAFKTSDGLTLHASLHLPGDVAPVGLVIFCPELGGDHWSATWYCRALLEAGLAVLGFDFRNQGQSDRLPGYTPLHWLTEYEVTDVLAAVEYVKRRPELRDLPMGLFGISRGGSAALVAAARCADIQCVACEGVFSISTLALHYTLRWASLYFPSWAMRFCPVWHIRSTLVLARWVSQLRRHCRYVVLEEWLPRLAGRPIFVILDGRDTYVLPEISEALFQYFPQGSSQRWLARTAKHNLAREVDAEEFDRRLVEFFSQMVARPRQAASGTKFLRDAPPRPFNDRVSS